jgi:hypothetical protein
MFSYKKVTCKGTLRQVFISLRPRTPYPPHTLYTCLQYSYSHREQGGWGGGELTREKVKGTKVHQLGRKYQHD